VLNGKPPVILAEVRYRDALTGKSPSISYEFAPQPRIAVLHTAFPVNPAFSLLEARIDACFPVSRIIRNQSKKPRMTGLLGFTKRAYYFTPSRIL
jgi:hypothetical protein